MAAAKIKKPTVKNKATLQKSKKSAIPTHKKAVRVLKNADGTRLKKLTRRQKRNKEKSNQKIAELPSSWALLRRSLRHLWQNKKLFAGILAVYAVFYILFVKGVSANFQLGSLRESLDATFSGKLSSLSRGFALYGLLLGSAGGSSGQSGSIFQTIILVIVSLALIWALRQTYASPVKLRVRDTFYKSTYPLTPFLIVLFRIVLQLLPALIASTLYSLMSNNGYLDGLGLQIISGSILFLALLWTLYMVSSSLFALYIVTLPDATPRASLKAAKKLVRFRRFDVMRKVFLLPVALLFVSAAVLIPLIILVPIAAELTFMLFTIVLLAVVHSYFYTLYRSLL